MATERQALDAKRKHSRSLMSRPGVTGVGVQRDDENPLEYFLAVHLSSDDPGAARSLPDSLDDCAVRVVTTDGHYRKQQKSPER